MSKYRLSVKEINMLKEGKWPQWSRNVKGAFRSHGTWSYIEGSPSSLPRVTSEITVWDVANNRIVGALCGVVEDSLVQEVEKLTTVKEAWTYLKSKTHQGGIISKLMALQSVIRTRITSAASINPMLADIKDLIANIYDKGIPMCKEWTIVILLQVLADGEFNWLRKQFITVMTKKDSNLTSDDIIKCLEAEASEAHANEALGAQEAAMVAKLKKSYPSPLCDKAKPKCMNCSSKGHANETCWEKGGGSEGKAPDWWKELKAKKAGGGGKKKREKPNAAVEKEDISSSDSYAAFIANIDMGIQPISNTISPKAMRQRFSNHPSDGNISCIANDLGHGREKCSIEWNNKTTHEASVTLADISPIPTTESVNITTPNDPFYVDSGATSHCSPYQSDFMELRPIPPHEINGINGTSIVGIGRGKIIIKIGNGRKLTLVDVLYVPQASLRLISVGWLADRGVSSPFDKTTCSLMRGSKTIATGTRTSISLYSLNESHHHIIECANIAHTAPDLEMWHKRLGHVNYASIIKMEDKRLATGMPTNLSTLPTICE
jgi:hypothetical protein